MHYFAKPVFIFEPMKSLILKSFLAVMIITANATASFADAGKPFNFNDKNFSTTVFNSFQDTVHPAQVSKKMVKSKKERSIKVLPKPHKQAVPLPVKIKPPKVKVIKPVVRPVMKIVR